MERQRSLERGSLLANVLKSDHLQRCGERNRDALVCAERWAICWTNTEWSRWRKGRYPCSLRMAMRIWMDRERWNNSYETQPILSGYMRCDLHSLEKSPKKSSLVRRLRCASSTK